MNRLQLFINDNEVDIESMEQLSQQFALTLTFSDLYEPDKVTDSYSKTIDIPGTNRNNQIFGSIWRIDADNYTIFNPSTLSHFRLLLNGELWESGTVELKEVRINSGNITYNIVLYGVITGLFSTLLNNDPDDPDNKLMQSLHYPNDFRHVIDKECIFNNWYNLGDWDYQGWFRYIPCQNGIYNNFESSKWLVSASSSSPVACQDITAAELPYMESGSLVIPDGTGMKFDEYRKNEYRSQYQRPAIYIKTTTEQILEDLAPEYDLSLDQSDFFSDSRLIMSPYESTLMTLPQYNTEKGDEDYVSYNNTNEGWIYEYSTPPARESSHDFVDIQLRFNQQAYGTYEFLHSDGYFYPGELPGNSKTLEVEFEVNFGVEDASGIRKKSQLAYLTEGTLTEGIDLPVQLLVKDQNSNILAIGTPYNSGLTPMTQPGGQLTDNYFNGTLSCRRQSDPAQIQLPDGNRCTFNPVNGFKRMILNQQVQQVEGPIVNNGYLMLKFGEVAAFCPEMNNYGLFDITAHPYKQTVDLSGIDRKFTLWVRVSNLTNCQFYGNVYSERPDARIHSDQENYRIGVRPIQKMTTVSKPFPVNHGYRGVDLRAYFLNRIQSGATVSKYDMFDNELSQGEFLLSLTKLLGFIYDVDKDGKVVIKSKNKYFSEGKILDWTDKLDHSKEISYKPLAFNTRKLSMKYNENDSYYETKYKKEHNTEYGEKRINTGYAYNTNTTELLKDNIIFQNTVMCRDSDVWAVTKGRTTEIHVKGNKTLLPAYYKKDGDDKTSSDNKYCLLVPYERMAVDSSGGLGIVLTDDNPLMFNENIGGNADNPCWIAADSNNASIRESIFFPPSWYQGRHNQQYFQDIPTFSNYADTDSDQHLPYDWNITRPATNYAGWTSETYPEGTGVYDRFWKRYITEIYNVKNKVMTAYFRLTPTDMLNFSFKNFVKINDTLWHPNKISDMNPLSDKTTKVELIKVSDISSYRYGQNLSWNRYIEPTHEDIELEYIANGPDSESSTRKNVWFDTGVIPSSTLRIEVNNAYVNTTANQLVVGSGTTGTDQYFYASPYNSGAAAFKIGSVAANCTIAPTENQRYASSTKYNTSTNRLEITVDGVLYTSSTMTLPSFSNSLYIFGRHFQNTADNLCYGGAKVYYVRLYDGDLMVHYYVPVRHWLNGTYVTCFRDEVTGNYLYNLGTDTPVYRERLLMAANPNSASQEEPQETAVDDVPGQMDSSINETE